MFDILIKVSSGFILASSYINHLFDFFARNVFFLFVYNFVGDNKVDFQIGCFTKEKPNIVEMYLSVPGEVFLASRELIL